MRTSLTGLLVLVGAVVARADTTSFQFLPNSLSQVRAISGDGSTVVGQASVSGKACPVKWTASHGLEVVGALPGYRGIAHEVSYDGSVIVGSEDYQPSGETRPFRWNAAEGRVDLGFRGEAYGVSGDGRVLAGYFPRKLPNGSPGNEAFRWTADQGRIDMGFLSTDPYATSVAGSVNYDGTVIIGSSGNHSGGPSDTFRWTPATGMVGFPEPPNMASVSANRLSANGDAMVGSAGYDSLGNRYPDRWTAADGWVGIDPFPGGSTAGLTSAARGVSADGSVIVGNYGRAAFIWTPARGTRRLSDVLASFGITDFGGMELWSAIDISDDGKTIVGGASSPDGLQGRVFVATIPAPSSAGVMGAFAVLAMTRHRRSNDTSPREFAATH